jgi:hypothetical protein
MRKALDPTSVIPAPLGAAVRDIPYWFVIGGQAIRCLCPYRPSRDVDFGVTRAEDMEDLVRELEARGTVDIVERTQDTAHLRFEGIDVSIFVLEMLSPFVEERRLTSQGILATKLHAILDRGVRRDFFDLYVTLQRQAWGITECLAAIRLVYRQEVNESLLLRALTYFDDAEREAPLPGEGRGDWEAVKTFFLTRVGSLLIPPVKELAIQKKVVDVRE